MLSQRQQAIYTAIKALGEDSSLGVSLRTLARTLGCAINTVRKDLAELSRLGWIEVYSAPKKRTRFRLCDPIRQHEQAELDRLLLKLKNAPYRGEALLKAFLDLLVLDTDFIDNARPSFLINPLTGFPLEYDRYYPGRGVAVEFNGHQHEQVTDLFSSPEQVNQQIIRDLLKMGLSQKHGVTLIIFRPEDLTAERVICKLQGYLPLRNVSPRDPRLALIQESAAGYQMRAVPPPLVPSM